MPEKIHFGVGCFHFSIAKQPPFTITELKYVEWLAEGLERLSNVDNVEIGGPPLEKEEITVTEPLKPIDQHDEFFPLPFMMQTGFVLTLPRRVQAELVVRAIPVVYTETDTLAITMINGFEAPVAFVELVNPTDDPEPGDAVVVVREYLRKHFPRTSQLRFEVLGPSPFHAKFSLEAAQQPMPWEFMVVRRPNDYGYPSIEFSYSTSVFGNIQEAKEKLYERLTDELSVFYYILQKRAAMMWNWDDIEAKTDKLVSLYESTGFRNGIKRLLITSTKLDEIFIALSRHEMGALRAASGIASQYRDTYAKSERRYLKPELDEAVKDEFVAPASQISQLIQLFETRRSKRFDALMLLVSAVLGGAVGSLLTFLLTRGSTH
jgi:hypothetical protein